MIEPIKLGDDLCPFEIELIDGEEIVKRKEDWNDQKRVALDLRTIDYLLQFPHNVGSVSLIHMISVYSDRAMQVGDTQQKHRFKELMKVRAQWIQSRDVA